MTFAVIILAAGKGTRYGTPKATAKLNGKRFLRIAADTARDANIDHIVAVVSPELETWAQCEFPDCIVTTNPDSSSEMFSSVVCGLTIVPGCDGIFITPVDHPAIRANTYTMMQNELQQSKERIVKPQYQQQTGHPVLLPWSAKQSLLNISIETPFNDAVRKLSLPEKYLEVEDPGILRNMNTPDDV